MYIVVLNSTPEQSYLRLAALWRQHITKLPVLLSRATIRISGTGPDTPHYIRSEDATKA